MKTNIKKIIFVLVFIFLLALLIWLVNIVYTSFMNKLSFENYIDRIFVKNNNNVFSIDKIVLFSSCNSSTEVNSNNTTTINDLTQYTDIAVFINNSDDEFTMENTLKSISIKDISFNALPSLGTPNLYYKSLTSFATPDVSEENLLDTELDFSVSSADEVDFSKPVLFNNCANPITLSYVNSDIKSEYTISNSSSIVYDGSLLKNCNVLLSDLRCSFSFTVYIENNLDDKFKCPVYIDVPLENTTSSIYDGSFTYVYNPGYIFYEYE